MVIIKLSEQIEIVIQIFEQCKKDTEWYEARFKDAEREENNIRHEMEGITSEDGKPPKYEHRARLATRWQDTLLTRRAAKNNLALYKSLSEFIQSDAGESAINKLKQTLGKTRQEEKSMEDRVYYNRKTDMAPSNPVLKNNLDKMIAELKRKSKSKY